jgi:NAD(P)H-hydrate epimerase
VIGGELGYSGAPRMAAEAALRVGAGLVTVATRPEHAGTLNITCPEVMCRGVESADDLMPLIKKANVIVLGPGLGQTAWSKLMYEVGRQHELPMVLDADGLNLLAQNNQYNENWILTPHPGEAARLIGHTSPEVQHDRLTALKEINKRYGGVCVLKGAGSLIMAPNSLPALCDKGNPGMASAGMGDVLSGVIGGLLAQGIPLGDAAKMGVCMHAMAGDLAAKEGERGMIAMDLMMYLRRLSNQIPI